VEGSLAFWKGRFFVSIMALGASDEIRTAVLELGRRIADGIDNEGAPPDLLRFLPERAGGPGEIHYFHNHLSLNRYLVIGEGNPLNLGAGTECLLASYGAPAAEDEPTAPYALLLVRYATDAEARGALDRLQALELRDADEEGLARRDDGTWSGARQSGRLLIGVFDAPTRGEAALALDAVLERLEEEAP
jgi:hypothetical protein